jgi:single-strand DNA-binding protein
MPTINIVVIKGNCTAKPELSYTPKGTANAKFAIGVSSKFKNAAGEPQERAEFFNIVTWKKTAEGCAKYLDKGQEVVISGRLSFDKWEDKEKQKHSRVYITAQLVHFGRKSSSQNDPSKVPQDTVPSPDADAQTEGEEDIPF